MSLDDDVLATFIPVEAVDAALAAGTDEARRRALAISSPVGSAAASVLVDLAGRLLAFGEPGRGRGARRGAAPALERRPRRPAAPSWQLIEGWLARGPVAVPAGSIPVAILDYQTPDHVLTSGNLGDLIQTLALLGNLARLSDVTFTGDDGLGALATELQGAGAACAPRPRNDAAPSTSSRSTATSATPRRSRPARGWSRSAGTCTRCTTCATTSRTTPTCDRMFVSFHVNRLDMLSDAAQAYLRPPRARSAVATGTRCSCCSARGSTPSSRAA